MKKAINLRLDESLLKNLDSYAAVGAYFDTIDETISDKRIDEVKKGNAEVFTLDQVAKSLGLK
ncbi:MAG: CopG family transcriptional regulator [Candidatus Delongbacteria bacterium]|nr:CopG family transcriptional regulator [Candidatus Delongbacteria bacterium]